MPYPTQIGTNIPNYINPLLSAPPPLPTTTGAYEDALVSAPRDYNNLQAQYGTLLNNIQSNPSKPITANPLSTAESGDTANAIGDLSGLTSTGGYSAQDIQDLRARGISPIRAVYANMQRELSRSRGLQGGYSPNFAAVSAKLARDQSNEIAQQTSNVNAGIAQNVASNKLQAAPALASASGAEASRESQIAAENEQNSERTQQENVQNKNQDTGNQLNVLDAQKSLYGTTPALASTFGNQALGAANINADNARAGILAPTTYGQLPTGAKVNPILGSSYGGFTNSRGYGGTVA